MAAKVVQGYMGTLNKAIPIRREFEQLHPRDQALKLARKASIERNWQAPIDKILPANIRPRMEFKKGAKCRIGDQGLYEEFWYNWSVEVIRGLDELSRMTPGRLDWACELLSSEVTKRQSSPLHPQRKIIELLLGDVQRVVLSMRHHKSKVENRTLEEETEGVDRGWDEEGVEGEDRDEREEVEEYEDEYEGDEVEVEGKCGQMRDGAISQRADNHKELGADNDEIGVAFGNTSRMRKHTYSVDPTREAYAHKRARVPGIDNSTLSTSGNYNTDPARDARDALQRRIVLGARQTATLRARAARKRADALRADAEADEFEANEADWARGADKLGYAEGDGYFQQ